MKFLKKHITKTYEDVGVDCGCDGVDSKAVCLCRQGYYLQSNEGLS